MAVSNSTDFQSTAVELIEDARRLLGIHAEEESLQAHELVTGRRLLTKMLKAWEGEGLGSWVLTEGSLTLVDSQGSYTFGSGGDFTTVPFEITQIRVSHDGGSEIEMTRLSREDYYRLPNRTTEGFPTQFYYDRQRDSGTLRLWPEPSDSDYDITFTYRRRIMDIDAGTDNFDLPQEWEDAITYGLAERMIPGSGRAGSDDAKLVMVKAAALYLSLKSFDTAEGGGSMTFAPDWRGR